ncbi:alpha/beta hydrolase [Nocardia sp. NPDC050406]|uniref:alpha/beta hydrolase n=1 Tax=Nocardia sp. NPDC050406 TaxID=3364318 RepID=UPI00378E0F7C
MPYFDGPRGRLHYRRRPIDHATATLALLPGTGQHSGHYHRFARTLAESGIELWTLDTSGHGLSEGDPNRPGTLPQLAADAHAFLAEIRTNTPKPLFLMGHSLGAATALATLAAPEPAIAGLVLCGTPKAVFDGEPPKSARGEDDAPARSRGVGAPAHVAPPSARPDDAAADHHSTYARHDAAADHRAAHARREPTASQTPRGPAAIELPDGLPVLVVHGVDDRRAPIDHVRQWSTRAPVDLREYADAGHDLLHEPIHSRVTADISDWIAAVGHG